MRSQHLSMTVSSIISTSVSQQVSLACLVLHFPLARSRSQHGGVCSLEEVRSLNYWGQGLTDISIIAALTKAEVRLQPFHQAMLTYCRLRGDMQPAYGCTVGRVPVVLSDGASPCTRGGQVHVLTIGEEVRSGQLAERLQVLSLSVNKISQLQSFASCEHLQELYLRKNEVHPRLHPSLARSERHLHVSLHLTQELALHDALQPSCSAPF